MQKRSKAEWEAARSRGTTDSEIRARLSGKHVRHRVLPVTEDDAEAGISFSRSKPLEKADVGQSGLPYDEDTMQGNKEREHRDTSDTKLWMLRCGKNVHRRVLPMGEDDSETRQDFVTSSQEASMTISRRGKLDMWKGDSAYDDVALEGKGYGERRRIIENDPQTHFSGQTGRQRVLTAPNDDG